MVGLRPKSLSIINIYIILLNKMAQQIFRLGTINMLMSLRAQYDPTF